MSRASRLFAVSAFACLLSPLATLAADYTFSLSLPIQCENMTVNVNGGKAPYRLLIIPFGNVTDGQSETRHIFQEEFSSTSHSFQLAYPARSQFVAVMSDANGVGTGGTTIANTVAANDDSSCLVQTIAPKFFFFINYVSLQGPKNSITQCAPSTFSADSNAQGTVTVYGVIPGGDTFYFDFGATSNYLFNASINANTTVIFAVGDSTGIGAGGSVGPIVVQAGSTSCLNENSPSSTAGSPAGGLATGSSSSPSGSSTGTGSSSTNPAASGSQSSSDGSSGGGGTSHTGAIVGGVVGGVVGLALITGLLFLFFCVRRRSKGATGGHQSVDLAGEGGDHHTPGSETRPPMIEQGDGFYTPAPFVVPEVGSSGRASSDVLNSASPDSVHGGGSSLAGLASSRARRTSQNSLVSSDLASSGIAGSAAARTGFSGARSEKKGAHPPSSLRAVNLVQHEDAEVAAAAGRGEGGEQVVELPPTYDALRGPKGPRSGGAASSANT